jgi:hypothetical protein
MRAQGLPSPLVRLVAAAPDLSRRHRPCRGRRRHSLPQACRTMHRRCRGPSRRSAPCGPAPCSATQTWQVLGALHAEPSPAQAPGPSDTLSSAMTVLMTLPSLAKSSCSSVGPPPTRAGCSGLGSVQPRPAPEPSTTAPARLWFLEDEQDNKLWRFHKKEGDRTKINVTYQKFEKFTMCEFLQKFKTFCLNRFASH